MRFTLNLAFVATPNYLPLAKVAEEAKFDTIGLSETIFFPRDTSSKYPYNDDGGRNHFENMPFLDAFALIPAMGAITERICFLTTVLKFPLRDPVIAAKQVASVAILTDNRLKLGIGTSPWPEEYEVVGIPWETRGRRLTEAIDIVRGLTAGGYFEYHGQEYDFPPIKMVPPVTKPVPILTGGHAPPSLRRAATMADGWIAPATGVSDDRLGEMLDYLQKERFAMGRSDTPFDVHVSYDFNSETTPEGALERFKRLEDLGVTDVRIALRRRPYITDPADQLAGMLEDLDEFTTTILSKVEFAGK